MPYKNKLDHNRKCLEYENKKYATDIHFRQRKAERSRLYQQKIRNCERGCYHNTTLKDYINREFSFVINFN